MRTAVQQNDPAELLEVFDSAGRPTGVAKSRQAIHLDGDWHVAFHCWIMRYGREEVVLQQRALAKDTYPGRWDAAAAGHWRFGESAAEAAREIAEELGIKVPFGDLLYLGRERAARTYANGLKDRELHEVYLLELDRPLAEYRPDPTEVSGLAAFATAELIALVGGHAFQTPAREAIAVTTDGRLLTSSVVIGRDDLVPYSTARLRRMIGRPEVR
jgi:isopentenyldiphosphate isomerase